ncbi:MAG TPA: FUSC family protein [Bordetella sp.]|nr:FUSC family protein [Bordetella sp.]
MKTSADRRRTTAFSSVLKQQAAACRAALTHDDIRLPLQTAAAVLLAYACMAWLKLPDIAWGAFSALFVVRASVEGTVGEATGRILGALIGMGLGVLLVLLSQSEDIPAAWSIVGGVGLAAYISIRWPTLSYSLVTVTMLTVAPDDDIVGGALQKTLAIVIGSASGILAAAAVMPLSAHRNVCVNLAASIEAYGDLLAQWASALGESRTRPRLHNQSVMEQARRRARDMALQVHTFPADLLYRHTLIHRLHERIDGLWRTATLMERAGSLPLSENVCRRLGPALEKVATATRKQIEGLAEAVRQEGRGTAPRQATAPLERLNGIIEDAMEQQALDSREKEAVEVIRWAWHEVAQELDALAEHLNDHGRPTRKRK